VTKSAFKHNFLCVESKVDIVLKQKMAEWLGRLTQSLVCGTHLSWNDFEVVKFPHLSEQIDNNYEKSLRVVDINRQCSPRLSGYQAAVKNQ
jgi:hypothetical protein